MPERWATLYSINLKQLLFDNKHFLINQHDADVHYTHMVEVQK